MLEPGYPCLSGAAMTSLNQCVMLIPSIIDHFTSDSSHENRFLIAGLAVKKLPDWTARQAAYMSAVKEFLAKLKPEFSSLPITFVRAIRYEPKLLLSVECPKAKQ